MSSMRVVFALGEYLAELRVMHERLEQMMRENDPWPENWKPSADWHRGEIRQIEKTISRIESIVEKADPKRRP